MLLVFATKKKRFWEKLILLAFYFRVKNDFFLNPKLTLSEKIDRSNFFIKKYNFVCKSLKHTHPKLLSVSGYSIAITL